MVDYEGEGVTRDYATMIQQFNRFFFDQISVEGDARPNNPKVVPQLTSETPTFGYTPSPATQLLGIDAKSVIICGICHAVRVKGAMSHVVDLVYPRKVSVPLCQSSE